VKVKSLKFSLKIEVSFKAELYFELKKMRIFTHPYQIFVLILTGFVTI
jgi:hypothetical protein